MLTQKQLKELLSYDPDTGLFTWLVNRPAGVKAGDQAGHLNKKDGYWTIKVLGKQYAAHRLAWFYSYGHWPIDLDHKDRVRSNNSLLNLREATPTQNGKNTGMRPSNTSGFKGVTWNRKCGKWQAQAKLSGESHHLGLFDCAEMASRAYEEFCKAHHGEFYCSAGRLAGEPA
jgi:hypothetical protein